ncbi:hypothetical protein BD560DRAFT_424047 [Blakeslea trispora]|nr:hypothetical protein BD560DRAFT_424047 [Blakeslea trispora]
MYVNSDKNQLHLSQNYDRLCEALHSTPTFTVVIHLQYHVGRFYFDGATSFLTCIYPAFCKPCDLTYAHFMHAFSKSLDHYTGFSPSSISESCNLLTFLELPLSAGFSNIPDNYWNVTKRPRVLLMKSFFYVDARRHCFDSLYLTDTPPFSHLSGKLRRDLLSNELLMTPHLLDAISTRLLILLSPIDFTLFHTALLKRNYFNY